MYLLLDIDNVLIKNSFLNEEGKLCFHWTQNLKSDLGIDSETLCELFNEKWNDVLVGKKTTYNQVKEYLIKINSNIAPQKFIDYWLEKDSILNFEMINLVKILQEKGFKICIGSNQDSLRINYLIKKFRDNFLSFDEVFTSFSLKVKKPNKDFFKIILNRLNINPNKLLFIDDEFKNINQAKELGINVFCYQIDKPNAINDLKNLICDIKSK